MFKKRALLLFFTIFSTSLFCQETAREVLNEAFESHPEVIYANGLLTIDESQYNFTIYIEKDDFLNFNQGIIIENETYKDFNSTDLLKETTLPLDIINNQFTNNEYSFVKKTNFKNIDSYIIGSKLAEETTDKLSIDRFEKRVITVGNFPRVILKCDFYKNSTDKTPQFTFEVNNIVYLDELYLVTDWSYKDVKNEKEYNFQLNIETITLEKQKVKDNSIIPGS